MMCDCEEAVLLRVSKTETNPGRPYFVCRDRDCRFFQWADVELPKKNKKQTNQTIVLSLCFLIIINKPMTPHIQSVSLVSIPFFFCLVT